MNEGKKDRKRIKNKKARRQQTNKQRNRYQLANRIFPKHDANRTSAPNIVDEIQRKIKATLSVHKKTVQPKNKSNSFDVNQRAKKRIS